MPAGVPGTAHPQKMDSQHADEVLASYFAEPEEGAAERILHTLIAEIATPYVRMVVASNLRGPYQTETNDAAQDVLLDLTMQLRDFRENQDAAAIRNFRAYAGTVA